MEVLVQTISEQTFKEFERKYIQGLQNNTLNDSIIFDYAWACISMQEKRIIKNGIILLEELSETGKDVSRRREYLFYLAVANNKLGDYQRAKDCVDRFLQAEPKNIQALELRQIICENIKKNTAKGALIIGAGAVLVGGLIAALGIFRKLK